MINILIGFCLMLLGVLILIPNIRDRINGRKDKYGAYMKIIIGAMGLFFIGLIMLLREIFWD